MKTLFRTLLMVLAVTVVPLGGCAGGLERTWGSYIGDANSDRAITAGELHQYVLGAVSRLQRNQTPELQGDAERVLVRW